MRSEPARATLGIGVVGAGPWGRVLAATVARLPGLAVARIAAGGEGWRAVVESPALDGLIVAAPARLHAEIALAAIGRALPVFVEKPLALSADDARRVHAEAAARGVPVVVDHIHLFAPAYEMLKHRVAGCGGATAIRARSGDIGPFRADCPPLWDWGPHDIALCLDLAGRAPETLEAARTGLRHTERGVGERWRIALDFGGELRAEIETGNDVAPKTRFLAVDCRDGTYVYDDRAPEKLVLQCAGGVAAPVACAGDLPLDRALLGFAAAIRDGDAAGEAARSLDVAVAVVETLERCEAAAGTRSGEDTG